MPNIQTSRRVHSQSHSSGRGPARLHPRWAYSGRIFAAAMRGGRRNSRPLESAGSAVMTLIGDSSDSSGTYTTPRAVLCAPSQAQPRRRRSARPMRAHANTVSFWYPSAFFGGRGDGTHLDAINATPTRTKKNRALPYPRRPHFGRGSLPQRLIQFRRRLLVELRLVVHALQDGDDVRLEHHAGHHDLVQDVVDLVAVEN